MRVLLTGAAGKAGTGIRPILREAGATLILLDRVAPPDPRDGESVIVGDLLDPVTLDDAFADGVDLVVHLGGHSGEKAWDDIVEVNITGTQRLLEAAQRHGTSRVLLASSTHAVGFWPVDDVTDASLPRPDTFYGVGKVALEALGSLYADRFGMTVVAARIGTVEERPRNVRSLSTWLSFADLGQLILATALTTAVGFHVVWAISANTRRWVTLDEGHRIGYVPVDDAEAYADEVLQADHDRAATDDLVGGAFADMTRPLGEAW